jgi:hypothetical protein
VIPFLVLGGKGWLEETSQKRWNPNQVEKGGGRQTKQWVEVHSIPMEMYEMGEHGSFMELHVDPDGWNIEQYF